MNPTVPVDANSIARIADAINALDNAKFYILAGLSFIIIINYILKWYFTHRKESRLEARLDETIRDIKMVNSNFNKVKSDTRKTVRDLSVTLERMTMVLEELRDRQRGVMSQSDSLRLICNYFNDVVKDEIQQIFRWSLLNNHYESRKDFIRKKIKTKMAEVFTLAKKSLNEFHLSVDLDKFFPTYKSDNAIYYRLVDDLWDTIEPVYDSSRYKNDMPIKDQQIEEMMIGVNNVIVSFCASIQTNINDIYREDDE